MTILQPGPTNSLIDVAGIRVGHAGRRSDGWLSGTTVILAPESGAVAGVDVRGGGPGTRETDVLDPRNMVEKVHAVTLSGGSSLGLATSDGVMQRLFRAGVGYPTGRQGEVVPIVPGAVIFDLGRGGDFAKHPGAAMGEEAYDAAISGPAGSVPIGIVGAGTGATAGGLKGAVGSASVVLADGTTVAVLVVVNSSGSCVDPLTGELYAARFGLPGEFTALLLPDADEVAAARAAAETVAIPGRARSAFATTIGVVATDANLTKAQCAKVSGIAHDGMARAIRPVHTMFDGDTVFTLATGDRGAPDPLAFHALLDAAGDCFTRAIGRAMLAAESVETPAGRWRSYRDAFPSAFPTVPSPVSPLALA
ncbi:MAG TPA: P1 family peptidase, partial [Dermatophilaceae bacterium]